jgi:hypothetical protein
MAFTRFHDDPCRVQKQLQQSTDPGRWILNVPGNGTEPDYMADPHVRIQTWGGNLMTNSIDLEGELRGVNRPLNRDCLGKYQYQQFTVPSKPIQYPTNSKMYTEESRAILPAWQFRDLEQVDWYYPPLNPQENTCMPFTNNLSTRILEKDYFVAQIPCTYINPSNQLPLPITSVKGKYVGGTELCTSTNGCNSVPQNKYI